MKLKHSPGGVCTLARMTSFRSPKTLLCFILGFSGLKMGLGLQLRLAKVRFRSNVQTYFRANVVDPHGDRKFVACCQLRVLAAEHASNIIHAQLCRLRMRQPAF